MDLLRKSRSDLIKNAQEKVGPKNLYTKYRNLNRDATNLCTNGSLKRAWSVAEAKALS